MLLLLDNYDSFTYNVYQLLRNIGADIEVVRNDMISPDEICARGCSGIIISPGPGLPQDAGITEEVIRTLGGALPILGICLGHQAIGEVFRRLYTGSPLPSVTAAPGYTVIYRRKRPLHATTLSSSSARHCRMYSRSRVNWRTARLWAYATRRSPSRASNFTRSRS